ncbi:MAG: hypothetical protein ACQESA_03225, partial [Patescibacteria group bacterium]
MKKIIFILVIFLTVTVGTVLFFTVHENITKEKDKDNVLAETDKKEGFMEIEYDKKNREFAVDVPSDYSSAKDYPLLFGFHGSGGHHKNIYSLFKDIVENEKVIGVYPKSAGHSWDFPGLDK